MKVRVKAGHPELEGEGSSILHPRSSQSLTITLTLGSGSWGKRTSELPLFRNVNLAAQPTSTRGLGSNLQSQRQANCPEQAQEGQHGPRPQPHASRLPLPAQAASGLEEVNRTTHAPTLTTAGLCLHHVGRRGWGKSASTAGGPRQPPNC